MSAAAKPKPGLGRGLSALFGDEAPSAEETEAQIHVGARETLPIEFLQPGRFQPRRTFDEPDMQALIASVKERGVLQPLLVRELATDKYEIVAGERRWRAAQAAGLHEVPVRIRELDDRAALEIALIENIQRENLTPLEEAEGYARLMAEFGHTQEALARALGKSRSHVANMLRLLDLPQAVKKMIDSGALTAGHARALIGSADPVALAKQVVRRGLNVRQTEKLAQREKQAGPGSPAGPALARDPNTVALEKELSAILGLRAAIKSRSKDEGGSLTIAYSTLEQLDTVLHRLTQGQLGRER
jgi:ParB family chromosome partitioning protein